MCPAVAHNGFHVNLDLLPSHLLNQVKALR